MSPAEPTRLGLERGDKIFLTTAAAVVGLAIGIAAPFVAGWVADLSWVPFQGPLRLIGSFDSPWATLARPLLGVLVGLGFAAYVVHESPVLHISSEKIEVSRRGSTRRIKRSDVAGIYRDGSRIVLESHGGRHLFEGEIEGGKDVVRDAFLSHGYPWETT